MFSTQCGLPYTGATLDMDSELVRGADIGCQEVLYMHCSKYVSNR